MPILLDTSVLIGAKEGPDDDAAISVVSLTERFRRGEPVEPNFDEMVMQVRASFVEFDAEWQIAQQIARGGVQMLGSSGTVTTLAAMRLGLMGWPGPPL